MTAISLVQLREALAPLVGLEQNTLVRAKRFRFRIAPEGLLIAPVSSGIERVVAWPAVEAVLTRFNSEKSFLPSRYKDLSFNASYVLALLKASSLA
jgi:hypothetical protein